MQPLAPRRPPIKARHVRFRPGFINKDKPFWLELGLQALPTLSPAGDPTAQLFTGQQAFF
jgi:hypothetical protein